MIETETIYQHAIRHCPPTETMTRALLEVMDFFDGDTSIDDRLIMPSGEPIPGAESRTAFLRIKEILGPLHPALHEIAHSMREELNR
jgi:hypothetical protein